jgi:hypothetical protein
MILFLDFTFDHVLSIACVDKHAPLTSVDVPPTSILFEQSFVIPKKLSYWSNETEKPFGLRLLIRVAGLPKLVVPYTSVPGKYSIWFSEPRN